MEAKDLDKRELIDRLRRSKSCWIDLNHYMRNEAVMRFKDFEFLQKLLEGAANAWKDLDDI
jgi:hypothetical protein